MWNSGMEIGFHQAAGREMCVKRIPTMEGDGMKLQPRKNGLRFFRGVPSVDVAIVGAGPYGLSVAAHLLDAKVDVLVCGEPMAGWRHHMPRGMYLKSTFDASSL